MNRFIIVVGSWNNEQWVKYNIGSILSQDYSNYKVLYFNDASNDNTESEFKSIVNDNDNFIYIKSDVRRYKTWFFSNLENYIQLYDTDVLVFLDGDDMFSSENVLSYLNSIYTQTNCWVTYGGMKVWDGTNTVDPYPQNSDIPRHVIETRSYRKDMWRTSHLKSMRGFVWKRLDKSDLHPNGTYMVGPDDLSIMFGALELCHTNKIYNIQDHVYTYNHSDQNNKSRAYLDHKNTNIDYEAVVRNRTPYDVMPIVTPTLAGGLGNQMFEIAAAAALAKTNNATLIIDSAEHILPNQGRNVNVYRENVFSKIQFESNVEYKNLYIKNTPDYSPIVYKPNIKTRGHFQSYKYFINDAQYIKDLFINIDIVNGLKQKYNITSNSTAIQVRRGDYYKFPDYHPLLPVEYYTKALRQIQPDVVYVFSDDIRWCKDNLQIDGSVTYMSDADFNELYLISLCKNIVISNSSFGWWSAFLHQQPDSSVYCPSVWFGQKAVDEGFVYSDLILPEWNVISV